MSSQYTIEEVQKHDKREDLWVIIKNDIYDLTKFADVHPAGRSVLVEYAGQDVTKLFEQFHANSVLHKYQKLKIGTISNPLPPPYSPIQDFPHTFGDVIPYGEPQNLQGWNSPYYKNSHRKLREVFRKFVQTEIEPHMDRFDDQKKIPKEFIKKFAQAGMLAFIIGSWQAKYYNKTDILGVEIKKPDYFHEIILTEEVIKYTSVGMAWSLGTAAIGLPPIMNQGSHYLKDRYINSVLTGEKMICLAITEPWAGSDVAGLKCTAELTDDGKHYIVNGMKKFITTGEYADIFTTAVRTGGEGFFGVSLLAIERTMPGVKTRKMNMQGVWGSGTAFITFENVKVPVEHLIGEEGIGFMYIMQNFNHERFTIAIKCVAACRCVYNECMKYAHQRKAFGKPLIEQPVIRQKLAKMIQEIETQQAWWEQIAYNMKRMDKKQEKVLAAAIGIAKAHGTVTLEKVVSEAVQIFGGNGYQRGGVATKVERYYREAKSLTQGGGSPEIMFDMGVRQAQRLMPKAKL